MPTTKSLTMKIRKAKPTKLWVMSVDLVGAFHYQSLQDLAYLSQVTSEENKV
jgi:hypothetical protein